MPPGGRVLVEGEIASVYDKGKGALIISRKKVMTEAGELLAEGEHGIFYMGAGGFGGDPGPKTEPMQPPEKAQPDFSVSYHIPENQAALYRLNGDLNPLTLIPSLPGGEVFLDLYYMAFALTVMRQEPCYTASAMVIRRVSKNLRPASREWFSPGDSGDGRMARQGRAVSRSCSHRSRGRSQSGLRRSRITEAFSPFHS